jgi:hypothetical protein
MIALPTGMRVAGSSTCRAKSYGRAPRDRKLLNSRPEMVTERVRHDLVGGLKQQGKGRGDLDASQVLGALVLIRVKKWTTANVANALRTFDAASVDHLLLR